MAQPKKRYMMTPTGRAADRIAAVVTAMLDDGYAPTESAALVSLVLEAIDAREQAAGRARPASQK